MKRQTCWGAVFILLVSLLTGLQFRPADVAVAQTAPTLTIKASPTTIADDGTQASQIRVDFVNASAPGGGTFTFTATGPITFVQGSDQKRFVSGLCGDASVRCGGENAQVFSFGHAGSAVISVVYNGCTPPSCQNSASLEMQVTAPAGKGCFGPGEAAPFAGQSDTCSVSLAVPNGLPSGGSVQVTLNTPTASVTCTTTTAGVSASAGIVGGPPPDGGTNTCAFINSSSTAIQAGTILGTEQFTVPAGTASGTAVAQTQAQCLAFAATSFGSTQCGSTSGQVTSPEPLKPAGLGAMVGGAPPPGNAIPALASANFAKSCSPTSDSLGQQATMANPILTTCVLTVSAPPGTAFPEDTGVTIDAITSENATFACTGTTSTSLHDTSCRGSGSLGICSNGINGGALISGGTQASCVLPQISVTGPTCLVETVDMSGGGASTSISGVPPGCVAGFPAPIRPVVSSISPAHGPAAGGTQVSIGGSGFSTTAAATTVKFGSAAAASVSCTSSTSCDASSPLGTGTVDLTVTVGGQTSATSAADQFSYLPPAVSGVSPTSGPAAGGTTVTISGSDFTGVSAVKFGPNAATNVVVDSAGQIRATSPAGSGTVDVTITAGGQTSAASSADRFTYIPAPSVSAISPAGGPEAGGTVVSISGSGFSGATAVGFDATPAASFSVISDSQITAVSPPGSGVVHVTVSVGGQISPVSDSNRFTYLPPNSPGSVSIQPAAGVIDPNSTAEVMLQAVTPTAGLGLWNITVSYDPNIVALVGCSFTFGSTCSRVNGTTQRVNGSAGPALQGTQVLATLSYQLISSQRVAVPLTVTVESYVDARGVAMQPVVSQGVLTVGPLGDVNRDGVVNAVDALCVLRSVAGLPATVNCPVISLTVPSPGDVNRDGAVNAVDALCILRSVAGLQPTPICRSLASPAVSGRRMASPSPTSAPARR
ncbi:MAG: IPT/TIG domain-containing protein [Dehalococcoidia bacterium]